MKRFFVFFFLLMCPVFFTITSTLPVRPEYQQKALILVRIPLDIEWPEEVGMDDKSKPFYIGVYKDNPFDSYLDDVAREKVMKGKKVIIKYISDIDKIQECNVIFISKFYKKDLPKILPVIKDKPILTVCDEYELAEKGVHVYLKVNIDKQKIDIELNEKALRNSQLTPRPILLRVSTIIK
jgi:hypothetical protein